MTLGALRSLAFVQLPALLALAGALMASGGSLPVQDSVGTIWLEANKPVSQRLRRGETPTYRFRIAPADYVRIAVQPTGTDVQVAVLDSGGRAVAEAVNRTIPQGPAVLSLIAEADSYQLQVRPSSDGSVQVEIAELRPSAARDAELIKAERVFQAAERIRLKGTADSLKDSIPKYEAALQLYRALGSRSGQADTLVTIGRVHDLLGSKPEALDFYRQSLQLYSAATDAGARAYVINQVALVQEFRGERAAALASLDEALLLARNAGDVRIEGVTLNNFGLVHFNAGDRAKALDFYTQALAMHRAVENRRGEGTTLTNLGHLYDAIGERRKAIELFSQALEIRRGVGDARDEATTLNNLGTTYFGLDQYREALDCYGQALEKWRTAGDRNGEAATLHNTAHIYHLTGQYQKALDLYEQSLALNRAVGYRVGVANTLNNMGTLHRSLGETEKATQYLTEALALHRELRNRSSEASTLTNIARMSGDHQKSIDLNLQALTLRRSVGDRSGEAVTLNNLGQIYSELQDLDKAAAFYDQALVLQRAVGSRRGEAILLSNLSVVEVKRGQPEKAAALSNKALELIRQVGDRQGEAGMLAQLGRAEGARGDLGAARAALESSLAILESLRETIADRELRSTYFSSAQEYYDSYIHVLMRLHEQQPRAGHDIAALEASERARARSLLEILAEADVDIRSGAPADLLERERSLQQTLELKAARQARVLVGRSSPQQVAAVASEVAGLVDQLDTLQAQIRVASPRYADLTRPQILKAAEIQALLDPETLLLQYRVGSAASYLWAVSHESITVHPLPLRSEIDAAARRFWQLAQSDRSGGEATAAAIELGRMLLGPVAARLAGKKLAIVADGSLQYIPFAALVAPQPAETASYRPLVLDHEIVTLPSASTLAQLRRDMAARKPAPRALAVLADPVFDVSDARIARPDLRKTSSTGNDLVQNLTRGELARAMAESGMNESGAGLGRLIGSRREAAAIAALVSKGQAREALDFEASRQTATGSELAQYRIVHFATHGLINSRHPRLSGLVLSLVDRNGQPQDGFLRLHEIYNLQLSADLVVLSACQTALGREVRGEGLLGLTRGFMHAGAPRVVASLWKVDDRATAELMKLFYEKMLVDKERPAAALRSAQAALYKQKRWQSPYYWAAFVLQGEWR